MPELLLGKVLFNHFIASLDLKNKYFGGVV